MRVARQACLLTLIVGAIAVLPAGARPEPATAAQGEAVLNPRAFEDPGPSLRPKFSWWWPGPAVEDPELRAEVDEMAAAGFGGAQLFEVPRLGLPAEGNPPETYMWGTRHWAERIRTAMQAARSNDFTIDLQAGSGWPWTSPAVAGENVDLSVQELAFGERRLTGGSEYVGPPPPPDAMDPSDRRLVAVTAARPDPSGTSPDGKELLDPESTVDLTPTLDASGEVHWDVPPGEWILFGFWHGPTRSEGFLDGQGFTGYLLDYLRRKSTKAATRYLDDHLFKRLGRLPRVAGDTFHEDSLEGFGARLLWTGAFLREFQARRGYRLARYLPALSVSPEGEGPQDTTYDFPDKAGERVRHDYARTLTELWVDNHVVPTRRWAHRHGLESAGRAIGVGILGIDVLAVAKAYDVPDIDHFTNSTIDWVRTTTSGARLSGAGKASSELGDLRNRDYMITLETLKRIGDRQLVGGANALDLHGYPYKFAHGADWPSWWPWSSEHPPLGQFFGISEGFTSEIPLWRHLPRVADYFARAQTVLRAGRPVADVALYRDAYGFAADLTGSGENRGEAFEPVLNSALTRSGFGFDMVNPDTLAERTTKVKNRRLVVQRPGYKALVIDLDASRRIGVIDNTDAMAASVAKRLARFARAGLPIVFVDRFPERGVSYRDAEREDRALRAAVASLESSPRVRLVEDEADVPAALAELGVEADLSLDGAEQSAERCGFGAPCVYSVHRRTAEGDYWFLWNAGEEPARFTGSFSAGRRAPELWDLWSGERRAVGLYRPAGERVEVPIELAPRESTVIGFERPVKEHVTSTDAEEVVARDGRLLLRSTEGGDAVATLSDGREITVEFPELPTSIEPKAWDLHVDGAVREGEEVHDLTLSELEDWREIPELERTSGTGTYRTNLTLSDDWTDKGRGAYLELGRVEGGVQVRVNGNLVHPAAVPPSRLDVGPFLRPGENTIEVELTTTLKNRLNALAEQGVAGYSRFLQRPERTQPYGLLGPVRLVPYAEQVIGSLRHGGGAGGR